MSGYGTPAQGRGPLGRALVAKRAGRPREKFAAELGVSVPTLAGWEQGIHRPTRLAFDQLKAKGYVPPTVEWSAVDLAVKKIVRKMRAKKAAEEAINKMKAPHREHATS